MNIYEQLLNVQLELKAPKNLNNSFGGFKYRSAEGIYEAVKPILQKHNLTLFVSDEIVEIGGKNYIKATATLSNFENQTISATAYARECEEKKGMDSSQLSGSSSSYARKYALNGLFLIDKTDVEDNDSFDNRQTYNTKVNVDNDYRDTLLNKASGLGIDLTKLAIYFKHSSPKELTSEEIEYAIAQKERK